VWSYGSILLFLVIINQVELVLSFNTNSISLLVGFSRKNLVCLNIPSSLLSKANTNIRFSFFRLSLFDKFHFILLLSNCLCICLINCMGNFQLAESGNSKSVGARLDVKQSAVKASCPKVMLFFSHFMISIRSPSGRLLVQSRRVALIGLVNFISYLLGFCEFLFRVLLRL
jgi:hypothetical protein